MSDSASDLRDDRLGAVLEDFEARRRAGEPVDVDALAAEHPDLADDLRALVPTIDALIASSIPRPTTGVLPDFEQLGPYRLVREIGRGGMGIVFEAEDERLGRRVALKLLPPQFQLAPTFLERFKVEVKAAATLTHDHIVPVYEAGEDRGVHYCAMQLIDGLPLDQLIRRVKAWRSGAVDETVIEPSLADLVDSDGASPLPAEASNGSPAMRSRRMLFFRSVARLMIDVCEAVAHAHTAGTLHRDLKPSNLIVDRAGKVWVSDFGLAKVEGAGNLTQTGEMLGTLRYLAPERLEEGGGSSSASGDIYALGLILYELLTLEPAFGAVDRAALVKQVGDGRTRRPRRIDPGIPPDLETIALKAMSPLPAARYPTAAAIADDLRAFLGARPIAARPPKLGYLLRLAVRRNRIATAAAGLAMFVVLGSIAAYVVALNRTVKVAEDAKTHAERERDEARFRSYAAEITAANIALERGDSGLARQHLDAAPAEHRNWEWHYLANNLDRSARTFRIDRGRGSWGYQRRVHVRYHPDGQRIVAIAGHHIRVWHADSGEVLGTARNRGRLDWSKFQWGPEGRWFAVNSKFERQVLIWSVDPLKLVRRLPAKARSIAVSPDGRWIATGLLGRLAVYDATDGSVRGEWFLDDGYSSSLAFTPDGKTLLSPVRSTLHCISLDGGDVRRIEFGERMKLGTVDVSADGSRVAVTGSHGIVVVARLEDGVVEHVLSGSGSAYDCAISADGTRVAAAGGDGVQLWSLAPSSTPLPVPLIGHGHRVHSVSFRPDGNALVTGSLDFEFKTWALDRQSTSVRAHLRRIRRLRWSPDHRRITTWGDDQVLRVWDSSTLTQITAHPTRLNGGRALSLSPDGDVLITRAQDGNDLVVRDPSTFAVRRRIPTPNDPVGVLFSRHGDRFVVTGPKASVALHEWPSGAYVRSLTLASAQGERGRPIWRFSADGATLVAAFRRTVHAIDVASGEARVLARQAGRIAGIGLLDGERLAIAGHDRTLQVRDLTDRRVVAQVRDLGEIPTAVGASADGTRLLTSSRKGRVTLWDAERLQPVLTLRPFGDQRWVYASFSPDGTRITIRDLGGRLAILDARDCAAREHRAAPEATDEPWDRDGIVEHAWRLALRPDADARDYRAAEKRVECVRRPGDYIVPMIVMQALRQRRGFYATREPSQDLSLESPIASDEPRFEQTRRAFLVLRHAAWKQPTFARKWLGWLREHIAEHGSHLPAELIAEVEAAVVE